MLNVSRWNVLVAVFLISACDNSSNLATALLPNSAPIGAGASVTTAEDTPLMAAVTASDPDGDSITVTITDDVDNGTLVILPDGAGGFNASYTPDVNFNGADAFVFTVSDGLLSAGPFTVNITVTAVNDAPVASDAASNGSEDSVITGMLTALDADGDALTFITVANPVNGVLLVNTDGNFTYTPNPNSNGADQFTFRANDGTLDSNVATVSLTIAPVNDAPAGSADSYAAAEDMVLSVSAPGVLGNDSDVDGDALTAAIVTPPANGAVTLNADGSLTYGPNTNYFGADMFTYVANDGTVNSAPVNVMISISAVNDTPVANALAVMTDEDAALNAVLSGSDIENDTLTFSLTMMPVNGVLSGFDAATGAFTYTPNTDYFGADSFAFRVNDGAADSTDALVSITVASVNDVPSSIAIDSSSVDEEQASGTVVGTLTTADADTADTHTYTLVAGAGDTDNASFAIVGSALVTAAVFDFETQANYSVRLQTDDGAGGTFAQVFAISVDDINDPPTDITLSGSAIDENQAAGTAVGTLSSVDPDSAGPFTYALVAGSGDADNASFAIVGDQLQSAAVFDFETQSSFSIRIQTDDTAGGTFDETFTITVNDINDPPTAVVLSNSNVDENLAAGASVGTMTSTDVDSAGPFVYTLVAGAGDTDNASFTVVGDQLQTAATFDFETQNSFSIRLQTDDGAGGIFETAVTITVNDVNDAPTDIALSNASVDENLAAGTPVGTITSADVDSTGAFVYALVAGAGDTDNASFAIVGDQLQTSAAFDFETQNSFSIRLQTDDSDGGTFEEVFVITVNDINEAPTDIALSNTSLDENQAAGTPVGTLSSTDVDSAGPFSYALVAGAGDTDNASFAIVADQLQSAVTFDFETQNSFSIRVETDDGAGGTFEEAFIITINDVNDAPTDIAIDNNTVDENQPAGTVIGTLTSLDVDSTGPFAYALVAGAGDTDNAAFAIVGDQLQSAAAFDFETQSSYSVRIQTDDGAGGTFEEVFLITVNDINDAPTDIAISNNSVDENQAAGSPVGTLTSVDVDSGGPFAYALVAGAGDTDNAAFAIVADQLQTAAMFDFETQSSYSVRIQTDDGAGGTFEEAFTIMVNDVNESPTDITLDNSDVDENQAAGATVGALGSTDVDSVGPFIYTLVAGAGDTGNASFAIVGDQLQTAVVLDFETQNSYSIRVHTDDGAGGTFEEAFIITVNDLNDAPTDITLDSADVDENEAVGTLVGSFASADVDSAGPFVYSLVAGSGDTGNGSFAIVGNQLQTATMFDFETQNSFSIRVQTDDGAGGFFAKSFIISINDVFDPNVPPVANQDNYTTGIGNTRFQLVAALTGPSTVPTVQLAGSVLDNDSDPDAADTISVTANAAIATSQGGSVAIDANGRFVYSPAATFPSATTDSFVYEVCDDGAPVECVNGTVNITGSGIVWYVDDSSPNNPGTGTAADPFRNLSSAGGPSMAGEIIFVHSGSQTTGITLKNNQQLLGQGVALVVGGVTLVNPGARPVLANPAGAGMVLASNNTVRGLNITGSTRGIIGTSVGNLAIDTVSISSTSGEALDLRNGAATITLDSVSVTSSPTFGVNLATLTGNLSLGSGAISGTSGNAFVVSDSTATISYAGNISTSSSGPLNISSQNAGSVTLSGTIGSTSQGIILQDNSGGTITLSGDLTLNTGSNTAFSATNGGTINVTGFGSVIVTSTASAVAISNVTIGASNVRFQSITSTVASSSSVIALSGTGNVGQFLVTGVGATLGSGGTIDNKTGDAITLNNTGARVSLANMIIEDIGTLSGGFNTRSQHDAIHGENVNGGLTLTNVAIRRISDMCVNGALFSDGVSATTWNGLEIRDSLIEDCNRFHVAGTGDTSDEGAVRIVGLTGTAIIDNSVIQRGGELLDLFTAASGTLTLTVTDSTFSNAFKEFTSGATAAIGKMCIDVTIEGSSSANVTIGEVGVGNAFLNCATASIRVSKDTVPAGNSNIDAIVQHNTFRVDDHSSTLGSSGNFPQGGVEMRAGPGGISTFDAIVQNNTFGVAVGPDDDIGSTTDEVMNANGVEGNLSLIFESGVSQARVNNNTFNGSINAPWFNRADGNVSAAVLYRDNSYRGRNDFFSPDPGFGVFRVPGIPYRTRVRNGGNLDISFVNDSFAVHDQFFFGLTENLEFESRVGGGTMCVALDGTTSPDGYEFDELVGTINLYQGAINNAATGPCTAGSTGDCQNEIADDGNRGGPTGYTAGGAPDASLNPPFIDVDNGSITITGTSCTLPSGGIF